jgi:hypothetical protein
MVFHEPLALITALQTHLDAVGDLSSDAFDRFSQLIPAEWIEQALQATGTRRPCAVVVCQPSG